MLNRAVLYWLLEQTSQHRQRTELNPNRTGLFLASLGLESSTPSPPISSLFVDLSQSHFVQA